MDSFEKVYRDIDRASVNIQARTGKDLKTWGEVFDQPTIMTLHRMLRSGILKSLDHPLKTGKEANVFKATMEDGLDVAVKIYRVQTATFRHILKYIEGDPRFRSVPRDRRELVHAWARKEYRNLERFRQANVDVPIPYKHLNNVIVMEYLANEDGPARSLKEDTPSDPQQAFDKLWGDYVKMLDGARSVHADFSEYNILVPNGMPRVIDVGQAVLDTHPMAEEFMRRDVRVFAKYFRGLDVEADEATLIAQADAIMRAHKNEEPEAEPL